MKLKAVVAIGNLAWHFALRLLKRLFFIRSAGLKEFVEFYRNDRIVTLSLTDKKLLTESARCISCGLCDSLCPALPKVSQEGFLGPSFLPHLSRSIPAFAGIAPLEFGECLGCRGCEAICPERVPIKKILEFMREKSTGYGA